MAKDYAKTNQRGKSERKKKTHGSRFVSSLILIVVGFLAGLIYIQHHASIENFVQKITHLASNKKNATNPQKVPAMKPRPEPRFEFYSILPKMGVQVDNISEKQTEVKIPSKKPTTYLLQVASLKRAQDADGVKAQLLLLGYDVRVEPFKNKGIIWYRVMVGPFNKITDAKNARSSLSKNNFNSILKVVT